MVEKATLKNIMAIDSQAKAKAKIRKSAPSTDLLVGICDALYEMRGTLTVAQLGAVYQVSRAWATQNAILRRRSQKLADAHPAPHCPMGTIMKVKATNGTHKGRLVTGRFVRYIPRTGRTEILVGLDTKNEAREAEHIRGWFISLVEKKGEV